MSDKDKRLHYYNGQFLQEQDLTAEQEYHLDRQRRHNRQLHTYGIAEGLTVTANPGASSATVSPGTAIDGEGRQIVLTQSQTVPFGSLTGSVLVVISYAEQTSDPALEGGEGEEGDTRWWERPDVRVIAEAAAPAADVRIRLARLQVAANGTVSQHDMAIRTSAVAKLGTEVATERVRLSRPGVAANLCPVLSSEAPGQADVTGNLSVSGTISGQLAAGIVGNSQLAANTVTTAKISDLAVTTGKIVDLSVTTGKLADNSVTAAKILDGAVGNAELANLAVDNAKLANNTINEAKFDAATRGKLTDALPRTGGGAISGNLSVSGNLDVTGLINGTVSRRLFPFFLSFRNDSLDTVTAVAPLGFRARAIVINGEARGVFNATLAGDFRYGGAISGIALIGPTGIVEHQICSGPDITRLESGNFMSFASARTGMIAFGRFSLLFGVTPRRDLEYSVSVGSVTSTQLTFIVKRSVTEGFTPLESGFTVNAIIFE